MAFTGHLIRVGDYDFPLDAIRYETYSVTYSTLDLDSYRDANGRLHRNALLHKVAKVEFNMPSMDSTKLERIMANIRRNYIKPSEKSVIVQFYVPELDSYSEQQMYVPDINFTIRNIEGNKINYAETRIAFIGY